MKWSVVKRNEQRCHISLVLKALLAALIVLAITITGPVFSSSRAQTIAPQPTAQEAKQTDVRELNLGAPIDRELAGGEAHSYRVLLTAGQYLHVTVEQKGIDVVVTLSGPEGQKITEVDGPFGTLGTEPVYAIAPTAGLHRLEVKALEAKAARGRYDVRVVELRESTIKDRFRIEAGQAFAEAESLRAQETATSLPKAIEKYSEALSLWRSGEDNKEEARTLNRIGSIHYTQGQYQKALEYYSKALPLWRAVGDRREEARTIHNFGTVYWLLGETQKGVEHYRLALPLWKAVEDRTGESLTLDAMGSAYNSLGRLEEAIDFHNQSLVLQRTTGERRNEATSLSNIAIAYVGLGDFQKALECFNEALLLKRAARDRRGEATVLSNIGAVYSQMDETGKALEYYHQALPLRRETADRSGEFATLHNIGKALGKSPEAFDYYRQALAIARDIGARGGEGSVLQSLGSAYRLLGDSQRAVVYFDQALLMHRTVGDRRQEAITLSHIGASYTSADKLDQAESYLEQALSMHRAVGDRSSEAATLQRMAHVKQKRGRLNEARADIEAALKIIEFTRSQFVGQQLRTAFSASRQSFHEFYIDLLMRLHREHPSARQDVAAFGASERARARSLLELLAEARADIRQGVDPVLLERERSTQQQLGVKSERLTRLLGGKHTEEQETTARKDVEAVLTDYQDIEAQIRTTSPRYAALTQPQPLSLKEIQQLLDKETLLLEYALGEERSYLWAVTPTSVTSFELPGRAEIEAAARRFYELVTTRKNTELDAQAEAAAALSRLLLRPVAHHLGRKRLLIVTDGALNYIPFAALPEPRVGAQRPVVSRKTISEYQPLVVNHEIVSLPSASVLAVLRRELAGRLPLSNKIAVLADPVFRSDDPRLKADVSKIEKAPKESLARSGSSNDFKSDVERSAWESGVGTLPRLQHSREEAKAIVRQTPARQVMLALDFAANRETVISDQLEQYRIVHFATHSLFNNVHPELSGIVLSLVDEAGRPQNGFLRLHEVYNLKLPAELVVLSGCRTALGKDVKGEGIIGLTRGFMYAGAARVVVSLWLVDDEGTAELMKRFYQRMLGKGLRPAAALRAAQIAMWKDKWWEAPYYWGGFVLQGEWR